jgi:hypothetical protein
MMGWVEVETAVPPVKIYWRKRNVLGRKERERIFRERSLYLLTIINKQTMKKKERVQLFLTTLSSAWFTLMVFLFLDLCNSMYKGLEVSMLFNCIVGWFQIAVALFCSVASFITVHCQIILLNQLLNKQK